MGAEISKMKPKISTFSLKGGVQCNSGHPPPKFAPENIYRFYS